MPGSNRILAIIGARSGSKGIPHKNIRPLGGKPLMSWIIGAARGSKYINRIIVSTDSKDIAEYARKKFGVQTVFRPKEFCGEAIIADVLRHCLSQIQHMDKVSRVVALQVDHPDRTVNLTDFLQKAIEHDIADAITIDPNGIRNGSIRILRTKDLLEKRITVLEQHFRSPNLIHPTRLYSWSSSSFNRGTFYPTIANNKTKKTAK